MPALFDVGRTASRGEVATVLRTLAAGVESGEVALDGDGDPVTVDVPGDLAYELELETATADTPGGEMGADDEPDDSDGSDETADGDEEDGVAVELEVELEWRAGPATDVPVPEISQESSPTAAGGRQDGDTGGAETAPATTPTVGSDPGQQSTDVDSAATFELFADRAGEWRWRLVHDNGNVIADSGEGYTRKENARKGLASVRVNAPGAPVVEESTEE